jgi:hypothetical protein
MYSPNFAFISMLLRDLHVLIRRTFRIIHVVVQIRTGVPNQIQLSSFCGTAMGHTYTICSQMHWAVQRSWLLSPLVSVGTYYEAHKLLNALDKVCGFPQAKWDPVYISVHQTVCFEKRSHVSLFKFPGLGVMWESCNMQISYTRPC